MSVYVDAPIWPFRRMMMCHMLADSVAELHAMADRIGVARRWFQNRRYPHYDICKSKRALAVAAGAQEIGRREFLARVSPRAVTVTPRRCNVWGCSNAELKWMEVGDAMQTANGFLIAKVGGWYCPVCAGSYGGRKTQL